jgi:hypothetical protein
MARSSAARALPPRPEPIETPAADLLPIHSKLPRAKRRTEGRFTEALLLARLELGLTQQEAGERIGLPVDAAKRTWSFYERGQREPAPERVDAIRTFLADAIARAKSNHTSPRWAFDEDEWVP